MPPWVAWKLGKIVGGAFLSGNIGGMTKAIWKLMFASLFLTRRISEGFGTNGQALIGL